MRKFHKGGDEAEVNMTPMLDIVFIMLIFFIVTASFVKEAGIDVNKPEDNNNNQKPPEPDPDKRAIAFVIDNNNRIRHDFRNVDISAVSSIIKKESVERPEANVVIQAANGAQNGTWLTIYDEAISIGIPRDKIVVVNKKD